MVDFGKVEDALADAKAIAWDVCHKIYVLMDDEQVEKMREYGYEALITKSEMNPYDMFETVKQWYEDSCALRFVQGVTTNHENPNEGFEDLIPQGADWAEDEDEDEFEDEE